MNLENRLSALEALVRSVKPAGLVDFLKDFRVLIAAALLAAFLYTGRTDLLLSLLR